MSKEMEELRKKLEDKKKELAEEVKITEETTVKAIPKALKHTTYDIIQDPDSNARKFLMVKMEYDHETLDSKVVEVRDFEDKTVGLSFVSNKHNLEYLFNKSKRRQ